MLTQVEIPGEEVSIVVGAAIFAATATEVLVSERSERINDATPTSAALRLREERTSNWFTARMWKNPSDY